MILETIETSEKGALKIVDGRVESINNGDDVPEEKPVEDKKELNKKDDSKFNWS